jgi:glycosyltransferase involved in cell wall biosynthesis
MQALKLKKMGFKWVYVPQGMLEPWSMSQKKWKKEIYFALKEKPAALKADSVRAVSIPEFENLSRVFNKCLRIPNGSATVDILPENKPDDTVNFTFMARLHHKKGIIPLVESWIDLGELTNNAVLRIAGEDEGELQHLQVLLSKMKVQNVEYLGGVYGQVKADLMKDTHFYVLPTFSEGFPSSVVEACQYGCVVLTTKGANFPEAIEKGLIIEISTENEDIKKGITTALNLSSEYRNQIADKTLSFVRENYSLKAIASQQDNLYKELLSR